MNALIERVRKIAEGAALMTETRVEMQVVSASPTCSATRRSSRRCRQLERLGPPPFDAADRDYAAEIQATLTRGGHRLRLAPRRRAKSDAAVRRHRAARRRRRADDGGSTDVGDVSWVVPTVQARVATYAIGTPGHSWQLTAQGKCPAGQEGHGPRRQGDGRRWRSTRSTTRTLIARAKADLSGKALGCILGFYLSFVRL